MSDTDYRMSIVDTFRVKALRTAHIIDDAFPTYGQLATEESAKVAYPEWDLAAQLYEFFRANNIPCDVENTVDSIRNDADRIRKSDLIVLDYNLAPLDTRLSVSLVRTLARTEHFNTIVVYTQADDLGAVWLNFAAALRGGWRESGEGCETADQRLAEITDQGAELSRPSRELMSDYTLGRPLQERNGADLQLLQHELLGAGLDEGELRPVTEAVIRREMRVFLRDDRESRDGQRHSVDGRYANGLPLWLQSGNCFLTIVAKPRYGQSPAAPVSLFDALDAALCDWRPNLLQIIVSEIQNTLELTALATHELHLRDPHTQVSLCYFLLMTLSDGEAGRSAAALNAPVHTILDKLLEGIRQRLISDEGLRNLGGRLLASELVRIEVPTTLPADRPSKQQALFRFARKLSGSYASDDAHMALLKLNAFLSSEAFRGTLTTGSILTADSTYWMCMTPACDMVDRAPNPDQEWLSRLHPLRPIVAARLKVRDAAGALKNAEFGRSIFLEIEGIIHVFDVMFLNIGGPSYEFLYLDGSSLRLEDGKYNLNGGRLWREAGAALPQAIQPMTFRVFGQVRANYASRYLQQTGDWLSRIGVDFIRWTNLYCTVDETAFL